MVMHSVFLVLILLSFRAISVDSKLEKLDGDEWQSGDWDVLTRYMSRIL